MPGYWWLRHRLSILIGGFVLASLVRLEGKKLRGIPLTASGAGGYSGRAGRARVVSRTV